jgi:Uma2 family endonuclease
MPERPGGAQTRLRARVPAGNLWKTRVGIPKPEDRVELVDGEVVEMAPIGSRHHACVMRLDELLRTHGTEEHLVSVQGPVRLSEINELQPDVALLKRREDFYSEAPPAPEDVLLVVKVSDTTLAYGWNVKLPLYARSGIPEVWIVDVESQRVEIYSDPQSGGYNTVRRYGSRETLHSATVPEISLRAGEIFGR